MKTRTIPMGVRRMNQRTMAAVDDASTKTRLLPLAGRSASHDEVPPAGPRRHDQGAEPDLLTDAQLAQRWQLARGTLANQRSQGRGPAYLKICGRVRYRLSDVEAYERAGAVTHQGAASASPPRAPTGCLFEATCA